ncbi:MAG TPA: hypothetical protein DD473_26430 [Planctomycetaceae bacterium]|nr:hypothetical protein [Planctomycetaceae bacterium]
MILASGESFSSLVLREEFVLDSISLQGCNAKVILFSESLTRASFPKLRNRQAFARSNHPLIMSVDCRMCQMVVQKLLQRVFRFIR